METIEQRRVPRCQTCGKQASYAYKCLHFSCDECQRVLGNPTVKPKTTPTTMVITTLEAIAEPKEKGESTRTATSDHQITRKSHQETYVIDTNCPECRKESMDSFDVDKEAMEIIMSLLKRANNTTRVCSGDDCTTRPSWRCQQCKDLLCDACCNSHKIDKKTKKHKMEPISMDGHIELDETLYCHDHQDEVGESI